MGVNPSQAKTHLLLSCCLVVFVVFVKTLKKLSMLMHEEPITGGLLHLGESLSLYTTVCKYKQKF